MIISFGFFNDTSEIIEEKVDVQDELIAKNI